MRRGRMKKKVTKPFRRKCHHCGKMATNPLVHHIVPAISPYGKIPTYQRGGQKTRRADLKGEQKITAKNYCNRECKRMAT